MNPLYTRRDMSLQNDVFNDSLALFASESQDIRAAAAFAAGTFISNAEILHPLISGESYD